MTRPEPRAAASPAPFRPWAALFLASAFVHVAVWVQYVADPFATTYIADALSYDHWAARIAENGLASEPVFHQSPLFPVLLAGIHALAPEVARAAWATGLQVVLAGVAIAVLVPIGRIWFGSTAAGVAGAALALLHGPLVFHALKLLPLPLALATQAVGLLALGRARRDGGRSLAALAGACWGLACLARAELLLFTPFALVALGARPTGGGRRRPGLAAAWLAGLLASVAPATIHNARRGDAVLIAAGGGENLFIGNQRDAAGGYAPLEPGAGEIFSQRVAAQRLAEQALGGPLRASQVSVYWARRALGEVAQDPARWCALELRKLGRVLHPGDPTDLYSFALERETYLSALYALPLTPWVLLLLGGTGIAIALRGPWCSAWPLAALAAVHLGVLLAFFVDARLRLPFLFALCPFGGLAIVDAGRRWRAGMRRAPVTLVALTAVAIGVGEFATRPTARDRVRLASVLSLEGRLDESLAALAPELSRRAPDALALDQAGWVLQKSGEFAAARERYLAALDRGLDPDRTPRTRTRLAHVLERLGRIDEAAEQHALAVEDRHAVAGTWVERALFRLRTGDREGAVEDLNRAAALEPGWPVPRELLREIGAEAG